VVERILRAAEITPLPRAPDIVLGALDVEGDVLPVLNLRRRFHLPERPVAVSDQFLIARAGGRRVILVIDEAAGIIEPTPTEMTDAAAVVPGLAQIQGVVRMKDGLVLIQDLEKFLSLDEAAALDRALPEEAVS
jgi:purine-binding chemotaxis protein CheW